MCEMKHRETVYSQGELELGIFYAKLQTLFRTGPPSSLIIRRVLPPPLFGWCPPNARHTTTFLSKI